MKTIQLKQRGIGRYSDVSPFPLGDLEVEIVGIPNISAEFRYVAKCNDIKVAELTVSAAKSRVTISQDKLTAGRFSCAVQQYNKGVMTKIFLIEELLITEVNGTLAAAPEIEQMRRKIAALAESFEEEKKARKTAETEMKEAQKYAHEVAAGLLKFAYEDYRENVYLTGGTFEEFLNAYGIETKGFTEKEIKNMKGE